MKLCDHGGSGHRAAGLFSTGALASLLEVQKCRQRCLNPVISRSAGDGEPVLILAIPADFVNASLTGPVYQSENFLTDSIICAYT